MLPEDAGDSNKDENLENIFYGDAGDNISPEPNANTHYEQETEQTLDAEAHLEKYRESNEAVDLNIKDIENQLASLHSEHENAPLIDLLNLDGLLTKREELLLEKVQNSANFPGDWTNLLQSRMLDSATKDRFIEQKTAAMVHMQPGEPGPEEVGNKYGKRYAAHYQSQIDNYDEQVSAIFSSTNIEIDSSRKHSLGHGNINEPGTVYLNAESRQSGPLIVRQKILSKLTKKATGFVIINRPARKQKSSQS